MNTKISLGEKIQQLRTKNGYSQEMLASLLGVSRQCIGHYESGRRIPNLLSLITLADTFKVPVDTFVSLMPNEKNSSYLVRENNFLIGIPEDRLDFINLTPMEVSLLNSFRKLSDKHKKEMLRLTKEKAQNDN